ncbi:hypothetical protein [Deinococcus rufus]|uniref:Uncharacterized protein n=1 Tax=Deinococcus rufus TaxID=2136097 RepID=A0ABV7ZB96_9DEIO
MTTKDGGLIVDQPLYHGLRWHQPGTTFPPDGVIATDEQLKAYQDGGFLITAKELAKRENPEAFAASSSLEQANATIADLRSQLDTATAQQSGPLDLSAVATLLPGVKTLTDVVREVKALQARASAEPAAPDLSAVTALLPGVTTLADLPSAVQGLQGQLKTLQAVHATTGGTEVPANFLRRGRLAPLGLTTYESLRGKTPDQLNAIEGITLEDAEKILGLVDTHFAAAPTG